jgi:phosphoribosylaminoimidazole carboxylase PurE protein
MLRLAANDAPDCARADLLREFFHRFGVHYDVAATGREPIAIDLTLRRLPGLQISSGVLQGARYLRTRENTDPTEDVGFVINPRGSMLLRQRGREIELGEGDATLVSFTETLDTSHRAPGDMLVLRFPRPQLAPRVADARDRELRRIPHGTPALSLLSDYVSIIEQEQAAASDDLQQFVVSHFYDLAAVAIGATRDAAGQAQGRGLRAIIAGAGGAAHLPGMLAALTPVPVLGVPVQSKSLNGLDSLLSIVQMPAGVPVATFAIGAAGAANAGVFAAALLAFDHADVRAALDAFRARQTQDVLDKPDPRTP